MKLNLYVSMLGYLEEEPLYFVELLDSDTKKNKQIMGLDTTTTIPNKDQQLNLPDLNDLEVEWAKLKEEKA